MLWLKSCVHFVWKQTFCIPTENEKWKSRPKMNFAYFYGILLNFYLLIFKQGIQGIPGKNVLKFTK